MVARLALASCSSDARLCSTLYDSPAQGWSKLKTIFDIFSILCPVSLLHSLRTPPKVPPPVATCAVTFYFRMGNVMPWTERHKVGCDHAGNSCQKWFRNDDNPSIWNWRRSAATHDIMHSHLRMKRQHEFSKDIVVIGILRLPKLESETSQSAIQIQSCSGIHTVMNSAELRHRKLCNVR